jgi:nicotinate-nucleotide adenylyltransferase
MKELGIMGGAFNPIHSRHLLVGQCAIDQLGLSKVLFVPSGDPPHKKDGLLDKEARFEMVQLA